MTQRDLRIARTARENLSLSRPLFITSGTLQTLYDDANGVSYAYNKMIKEKGEEDSSYLSAGKLHATAVLHLLYQCVLDTYLKESNPDLFSRALNLIETQESLIGALAFFDDNFPSPLLRSIETSKLYYDNETLRAFFIHQVMLNNPALVNAAGPLVSPEGMSCRSDSLYPQGVG